MSAQLDTTFDMISHFHQLAEHEKSSLARQLHDDLGGHLLGAVMDMAMLAPRLAAISEDTKQRMVRVRAALGAAIELTRRITEQLHPTLLDNVGLFAALRWQLKNICARTRVKCTDDLPNSEPALTPRASIALFRSAQEALAIGLERDDVTELELFGTIDDQVLSIEVKADGANLNDEPRNLGRLTLESIRHRIRALGGAVNVGQPPGGGIVVAVSAPVANVVKSARSSDR